jgi:TonB-dependent Receptor Plug Domain
LTQPGSADALQFPPRPRRAGVEVYQRAVRLLAAACLFSGLVVGHAAAQEPPDSLRLLPDTILAAVADTSQGAVKVDSLGVPLVESAPDSTAIPVDTFPAFPGPRMSGFESAVWFWDRGDLLSNRALTLTELVMQIPGVIGLRNGDYGTPATVIAFGGAGGRTRVFWDGVEMLALQGSVPDLSRIGLAALESVRVERDGGELRIEIITMQPLDAVPTTLIEVGTGDLRTNLLRVDFAHPNTLGGALTGTLDRLETRGPSLAEGGTLSGFGLRYGINSGNRGGITAELRRYATRTEVEGLLPSSTRADWNLRGRWVFDSGLTGEAYYGASTFKEEPDDDLFALEARRTQAGVRFALERGPLWASLGARRIGGGGGVPKFMLEAQAGGEIEGFISGDLRAVRSAWEDISTTQLKARVATVSRWGFRAFGSVDDGGRGLPFASSADEFNRAVFVRDSIIASTLVPDSTKPPAVIPDEPVAPLLRMTDRRTYRVGGSLTWRGITASGAYLSLQTDSLFPTGLPFDRNGVAVEGGTRTGYEVAVGLPLGKGWRFDAAYQTWDQELPYLPKATWDGELGFYGRFKESGNLEVWGALGVMGRDPMALREIDPAPETFPEDGSPPYIRVPFHQEWYAFIQVRVVSVSIFLRWENITGKDNNMDFPDRALPRFRTLYGIRWTLTN